MFGVRQLPTGGAGGASLKSISDFAICNEISFHNAAVAVGGGEGVWITTATPSFGAH